MNKIHYIKQTNGKRNLFYYPDTDELKISSIPGKRITIGRYPVLEGPKGVLTMAGLLLYVLVFSLLNKYDYAIKSNLIIHISIFVLTILLGLIYKKFHFKRIEKAIEKEKPEKYSMRKANKLYTKNLMKETFIQVIIVLLLLLISSWFVFNTNSLVMAITFGMCIIFLGPIMVEIDFIGKIKLIYRLIKEK